MTSGRKADYMSTYTGKCRRWILWRSFLIASIFSVKGKNMSSAESEDRGESVEV